MAIAGRVAIVPKGDWSANATYKRLDAVTYNNTLYFAKKDVPAGTETSNTEYWSKSIVGSVVTVDDALSSKSANPVQNKVVTEYIDARKSSVGQNLITYPYDGTEGDNNGITWTVNEDGSVTANGTASKETPYSLIYPYSLSTIKSLQLGYTYTISDGLTDEQHANIGYTQLVRFDENNPTRLKYGVSSIKGTEIYTANDKNTLKYGIRLIIREGANADNITFKPMLEIGSIAHMYQPTTLSNPTLKKKIENALQPESIVNNQVTTEAGYALDARQANPNIDGTLAKQLSDLNGSLNNLVPEINDCDLVTTHLAISNNALNNPYLSGVVSGAYALILTVWTPTPQPFNQQIAFVAGSDEIALRACGGDGKWGKWKKINVN